MTVLSSAAAAGAPDSHPQPAPAPAVPSGPSPGVGAWYGSRVDFLLGDSGASWYYTWAPHHDWITTPAGCEFVPMILGRQDVTAANLQSATTHGRTLLGLHQPDKKGKSSLSPSAALSLWPQLERSGLRLGAPAVTANAHRQGGWLDVFMSGGQARDEGWTSFLSTGIRVPRSSTPVTPTHPDMVSQVVAQHPQGDEHFVGCRCTQPSHHQEAPGDCYNPTARTPQPRPGWSCPGCCRREPPSGARPVRSGQAPCRKL